jgi:hypothetical protein
LEFDAVSVAEEAGWLLGHALSPVFIKRKAPPQGRGGA